MDNPDITEVSSPKDGLDDTTDRPVPFVLRVAVRWIPLTKADAHDGLFFSDGAGLTGELEITSAGGDLTLSDIEVDQ